MVIGKTLVIGVVLALCFFVGMMPEVCALCSVERAPMTCHDHTSDSHWTNACCCLVASSVEAAPALRSRIVDTSTSVVLLRPIVAAFCQTSPAICSSHSNINEGQRLDTPLFLLHRSLLI